MTYRRLAGVFLCTAAFVSAAHAADLKLNDKGYFTRQGLDVMVFNDYYPDGHQTGVTVIQHGTRVAANGDLRLEPSPGQWSPIPVTDPKKRVVDSDRQTITQTLSYPDPTKNRTGFNPIFYPDLDLSYRVSVTPVGDNSFRISVSLDKPLPPQWVGKVGFNFELFPQLLFGKAFLMDGQSGIFPRQPNGPVVFAPTAPMPSPPGAQANGTVVASTPQPMVAPLATGKVLIVAPDEELQRMRIESLTGTIELIDGRANHNNSWFIVRGVVPAGATTNAIEWLVTPHVEKDWQYEPVIQVSQVGYAPGQPKQAVFELDPSDQEVGVARLYRLTEKGREEVLSAAPGQWGSFLRYNYRTFDFSKVDQPGMYVVSYRGKTSHPFKIGEDVYARGVWQPTLEYFLPVQMCHMRVSEKYRVWHGLDHMDDALMAPTDLNHFDGYVQGPRTLTRYKPGDIVPGLDVGGWHDAGDYDMRVESQIGTIWLLAKMVEEFGLDYDATRIDQKNRIVEIRDPDGKNDALQQVEHGLLSVMGGYRALGRLYRGIIEPTHRQYVHLGDAATMSDNVFRKKVAGLGKDNAGGPIEADDRWVFTEENPSRELYSVAGLAAASRVMKASDPGFAAETLAAARVLFDRAFPKSNNASNKVFALSELFNATGDPTYMRQLVGMESDILANVERSAWMLAPILDRISDAGFKQRLDAAVAAYQAKVKESARTDSPYGVPYKPDIWGAGWQIQERGVRQYFFHRGWPQHTDPQSWVNALNFVLGVHPGENTISFASGVGSKSATVAYGVNRADWSYIPGGVISGTALIRPDLPELKTWPFFWQQTEYVLGRGTTDYLLLVLAADHVLNR